VNEVEILAADLRVGDVWLGNRTNITVREVRIEPGREFRPWHSARTDPTVEMDAVVLRGVLHSDLEPDWEGQWTLQADQPLLVRRDDG
jgi:hypothetical protein